MRVTQAFPFELDPNRRARMAWAPHVGAARFAYNWGLARCREALARGERIPQAADLHKGLRTPLVEGGLQMRPPEAFRDLERAFRNWKARRAGFPRFKEDNTARLTGRIRVTSRRHVRLPRIGEVRTKEGRTGCLRSLTKVRPASFRPLSPGKPTACEVERSDPEPREVRGPEDSDGTRIEAPKPLAKAPRRLRRRKQKPTVVERDPETGRERKRNYEKAALRLARLHRRVRNIRRDFLHQLTTWLAKTKPVIVVEDLNVRGLMRNRHLSRSISDVGWGAFRRTLEYKCRWYGATLIVAPWGFPSTRLCSRCGKVAPHLPFSQRTCGLEIDRDYLQNYGLATLSGPTGSSPGSHACGDPLGGGTAGCRSMSHGSFRRLFSPQAGEINDDVRRNG